MKRDRKAKILATLGSASSDKETIAKLFNAGVDVFRLNMSHISSDAEVKNIISAIREVEARYGRPIGVLVDLQGPKLRIGDFACDSVVLSQGNEFSFDSDPEPGDKTRVQLPHPEVIVSLKPGDNILLDDGRVVVNVTANHGDKVITRVVSGQKLSSRKGFNLPDTELPMTGLSDKDSHDLQVALAHGADWIAVSFVQRADDIKTIKDIVNRKAWIMAKIEKPQAVNDIDQIVEIADGVMVARGDLGVEMPLEKVPGLQKRIVRQARKAGKPVVVATQMLESMINSPVPTRAEVSDVATAIFDGVDGVMLSAESAIGDYPIATVATMSSIIDQVERDTNYIQTIHSLYTKPEATGADAISFAARVVAETINVAAIVCYTSSGVTGLRIARERPTTPIITISPNLKANRCLTLVWGVHCIHTADAKNFDDMIMRACKISVDEGFATSKASILVTAGMPFGTPGATNLLRIVNIE